jgi:hypothetical protein
VARTPTYKKREELSSLLTHKGRQWSLSDSPHFIMLSTQMGKTANHVS